MFNTRVMYKIHNVHKDQNGNLLALDIEVYGHRITLATLYGPNRDEPLFYEHISNIIEQFQNSSIILVGDWNMVMNYNVDTKNYKREYNYKAKAEVRAMMEKYDLKDIWRVNNLDRRRYTWKQKNPLKMGRLDYFIVSDDIVALTVGSDIITGYRTDHSIITLALNLSNSNIRGKGFFKLNTSVLKDITYIKLIKKCIADNIERYAKPNQDIDDRYSIEFEVTDRLFFDTLKMEIRRETISYSAKKKRERDKTESDLIAEIYDLENKLQCESGNTNILQQHIDTKNNLLQIFRAEKMKGIFLRSHITWYEQGEKPTRYFCNLEKKRYIDKTMYRIEKNGQNMTDQKDILNEVKGYYENLYTKHLESNKNEDVFLDKKIIQPISQEQKLSCEGRIKVTEIKDVLKTTANNKSPGTDGITMDFYKVFFNDIGPFLVRAINDQIHVPNPSSLTAVIRAFNAQEVEGRRTRREAEQNRQTLEGMSSRDGGFQKLVEMERKKRCAQGGASPDPAPDTGSGPQAVAMPAAHVTQQQEGQGSPAAYFA